MSKHSSPSTPFQNDQVYTYIRKKKKHIPSNSRVIRIEVFSGTSGGKDENAVCDCKANVCVKHVVTDNPFQDDIYKDIVTIIKKIGKLTYDDTI